MQKLALLKSRLTRHTYEFFMSRPRERVVRRKEIDDFIVVAAATSSSPIAISELYGKL